MISERSIGQSNDLPFIRGEPMTRKYSAEGLARAIAELSTVFDLVRVVDPICAVPQALDVPSGSVLPDESVSCYGVWNGRSERCANCISLRAQQEGERQTKYEFIDNDLFYVVSTPIEVDGKPLALEIVSKVNDQALFAAYGFNEFVNRITAFNAHLHLDDVTGLFNRRYFDEKLFLLYSKAALNKTDVMVAMLDVDGFEHVSNHFGRQVADEAIIAIGRLLTANVSHRRGDFVARYDANTFMIVMDNIPRALLRERLVQLVQRVTVLRLMGYEDVRLNVAMGVFLLSENRDVGVDEIPGIVARRVEVAKAAGFNRIAFSDW